jgi:hypothetical protein
MDITHTPRHLKCYGCGEYLDECSGEFTEKGDFYCEFCVKGDEYGTSMVESVSIIEQRIDTK